MPHPRDNELLPIGTRVFRPKTGQYGVIRKYNFQYQGTNFLNYEVEIEGKKGLYCCLHDEIEMVKS